MRFTHREEDRLGLTERGTESDRDSYGKRDSEMERKRETLSGTVCQTESEGVKLRERETDGAERDIEGEAVRERGQRA